MPPSFASFPARRRRSSTTTGASPENLASLRAPIFEEKVVDFLLELVTVKDKTVSREELLREDEEEGTA